MRGGGERKVGEEGWGDRERKVGEGGERKVGGKEGEEGKERRDTLVTPYWKANE